MSQGAGMAKAPKLDLDETTIRIARQMLSAPPKPHDKMKIGKSKKGHGRVPLLIHKNMRQATQKTKHQQTQSYALHS
jgi:hypothetical protein